jgi:predicted regulator of Ras-like GTPase activity (Roadblock/LC7/MglB family)
MPIDIYNWNVVGVVDAEPHANPQKRAGHRHRKRIRGHHQVHLRQLAQRRRYPQSYSGNTLARLIPQLVAKAKSTVRDLDSHNELKFMRLKTTKYEILVAPDNEFILIVVQGQKAEGKEEEEQ